MAIAPAMMAGLGTALTVAQIGMGVVGSIVGASNEAAANQQAADIAEKNRKIAGENADQVLLAAQDELATVGQETRQLIGEQEAVQASSGLKLGSRSFVQTRAAARHLGRLDQLNVAEAAQIRAQAYRNEGDVYAAEAMANRRAAGTSTLKGFLGAASSIVGGAGSLVRAAPTRRTGSISVPSPVYV